MLRADELVLQLRHFLLRPVEHATEIVSNPEVHVPAGDARAAFDLAAKTVAEFVRRRRHLLEQRRGHALGLVEQAREGNARS